MGQSGGGVGIDTRLPNAHIEKFGDFGQGLTLAKSLPLTFPRSLPGRALHPDSVAWEGFGLIELIHIANPTVFSLICATCVDGCPVQIGILRRSGLLLYGADGRTIPLQYDCNKCGGNQFNSDSSDLVRRENC